MSKIGDNLNKQGFYMRYSTLRILFIVISVIYTPHLFPKNTKRALSNKKDIKHVKIWFPDTLPFKKITNKRNENILFSQPFSNPDTILLDERYISENYIDLALVHLTTYEPYDPNFVFNKEEAAKFGIILMSKRKKLFGNEGTIYKLKQRRGGTDFIKWVSVFGNKFQTVYVVTAFRIDLEKSFLSTILERIVESAYITDDPL